MAKITLQSKNGECMYIDDFEADSTISHIKRYLVQRIEDEHPGVAEDRIRIIFKGKTVDDAIPLQMLGENMVLVFDVAGDSDDIPTNDMSMRVSVSTKDMGEKMRVDPTELVTFNGQVYLVKSRKKVVTLAAVADFLRTLTMSREDAVRLSVFFLLLCTKNGAVVFILACVFAMELVSRKLAAAYHNSLKSLDHIHRSFYMFFLSLFIIDHSRF